MGLFGKLFGRRQPAPPFTIHPDDEDLVSPADIEWWNKLSLKDCQKLVQVDDVFRMGSFSQYREKDNLSAEDAAKKVRRSHLFYYLNIEHRANEKYPVGAEDAKLPYVLKDRVNRAVTSGLIDKNAFLEASSVNALVRALIRACRI